MPLGMEVGLFPDDFVLDGDPAPSPTRNSSGDEIANVNFFTTTSYM